MSSNRIRRFLKSYRFRIAANYFALVVVTSAIVFGFLYYLIAQTLREKDQRIIDSEFKRFAMINANDGVEGFERWAQQKKEDSADVFVRLIDKDGKVLFDHRPALVDEIGTSDFQTSIDNAEDGSVVRLQAPHDIEDAIEYKTGNLADGRRLQFGKDTEDREELLEKFRDAFVLTLVGALAVAILTGFILSRTITTTIRKISQTIDRVKTGDLKARVDVRASGDELDDLGVFLNSMLQQNSKLIAALGESLDAVSHDLRTPLTKLRANAENLLQISDSLDFHSEAARREALGEILENTDQLIELINAIFDMSEAEAGAMKLRLRSLKAREFFDEIVDVYSLVAEEKSIVIRTHIEPDFEFSADIRMKQAVANLVDNAIKFSPASTVIDIFAEKAGGHVHIRVVDQGPGVSIDDRDRIWERLYRGDQSRSTRGMGLGLSLVRAIASAHGGKASLEIKNGGRGSTFSVVFPNYPIK